ncbi:hypothetical protein PHLCEN_2v5274 [Hermanssonia centrifuga]|uniref:Uncharacterized protein n=1 Tax=Hermanssonia centrifuga TaxID=98765 RepID=A0A2R6P8I1_9APHY|nr:hypothetical protein PHLCEN_2v5274 [Hermanssonia centrifuga]
MVQRYEGCSPGKLEGTRRNVRRGRVLEVGARLSPPATGPAGVDGQIRNKTGPALWANQAGEPGERG